MFQNAVLQQLLRSDPVVVTGMGCVTCAGAGTGALWEAALNGRPGGAWGEFPIQGQVHRFPVARVPALEALPIDRKVDRSVALAIRAATEAWTQAGISKIAPEEVSVVAGTSRGPHQVWTITDAAVQTGHRLPPRLAAAGTLAALSGAIAQALGAHGPGSTLSATCASGAVAIAAAAEMLALGRTRIVLAGGADAPLNPGVLLSMSSAGLIACHPDDPALACRPFDHERNGFLPAEGAGFLALERASSARARGAAILGVLSGWATATEGEGRSGVDSDGHILARTITKTLDLAGLDPRDVDYVNAHGTGTLLNDTAENAALGTAFPQGVPPVSSTKAITGHPLGASPAIEAILCLLALRHQQLPGSVNTTAPAFPLDFVPAMGRAASVRHALSNSLGFWGYHAALVFSASENDGANNASARPSANALI